MEEQFYLIAPLLLFVALREPARRRHGRMAVMVIGALAVPSQLLCYYFDIAKNASFVFDHVAFRFWELAFGVLRFLSLPRMRRVAARLGTRGHTSGVLGLLLVIVATLVPDSDV